MRADNFIHKNNVGHSTSLFSTVVDNITNTTTTSVMLKDDNEENDLDNLIIPTAEGLIRLRELHNYLSEEQQSFNRDNHTPNTTTTDNTNHTDKISSKMMMNYKECQNEIAKFPQESLHSFRFSSSCISTTSIRDELLKKKKKVHGTLPGHHLIKPSLLATNNRSKTNTVGSPVSIKTSTTDFRKAIRTRRETLPPLSESPPTTASSTFSSSSSISSSSSNNSTVYSPPISSRKEEKQEYIEVEEEEEDCYVPHLHNRLKQQNQAILTTYDDWRIILTNSIAQDVLVSHLHHKMNEEQDMLLVGKSVMDLIEPTYQNRLKTLIVKRRNELMDHDSDNNSGGMVLVCGNVIPIIKLDGTKSSASLWLKEKINESGSSVFIWIFEEVYESSILLNVNDEGTIIAVLDEEGVRDLYDYESKDILNKPINVLIPSLANIKDICKTRFFGSCTKRGAQFPIIARQEENNTVRITSMPVIAGLMTIKKNGIIEGCNDIFVKYLFGFSQQELIKKNISEILPQFSILFKNLARDDLLQPGLIINNIICRKLLLSESSPLMLFNNNNNNNQRLLTHTPNNQPLPVLMAMHRDSTLFEVQLQLKLVETEKKEEEYALWISFDRELAFKRYGHHHLISLAPPQQQRTPKLVMPPSEEEEKRKKKVQHKNRSPIKESTTSRDKNSIYNKTVPKNNKKTSNTGGEEEDKEEEEDITYSTSATIDDYDILDDLGQGAYGLVKLAIKRNDPLKKKVVIKYVIKSRILVDCWTRDRKLGTVPVEIHILHTLRKHPHENLGDMLDYFEDSDYYYIVMGLHGEGMDLFDYIELNDCIEEKEICRMFKQIALGVQHLHDNKIVHRDIKDENVVLDHENGGLRLIDFGSAAYLKSGRKYETFVGTLDYAAPEILRGHTYSGKPQDVWALGILLFTLVYRENPFYDIDEIMGRELRIPFVLSQGSVDLISKMLERDVDKRIDIHQVLAHPWLN